MRILAWIIAIAAILVTGTLLWKFVLSPALYASGGGAPVGGASVTYTDKKPTWGAKSKTELACAGLKRGQPFMCGTSSPTGQCICP